MLKDKQLPHKGMSPHNYNALALKAVAEAAGREERVGKGM